MIEILFPGMVEDQPEYYQDDKLSVTGTGSGEEALGEPHVITFVVLNLE